MLVTPMLFWTYRFVVKRVLPAGTFIFVVDRLTIDLYSLPTYFAYQLIKPNSQLDYL